MTSKNTLRQVRSYDLYGLKDSIGIAMEFYVQHCDELTELSKKFGECEDDTFKSVLRLGLQEYKNIADTLEQGDRP